ncbi:MAG TPA: hypothetical protein VIS55_13945 [Pseudomonadales bacterium]|jgi:hypothetical protein
MSEPTPIRPQPSDADLPALYPLTGVVLATVLGSFIAAVVVVYLNYRSLGSTALARKAVIGGLVVYAGLLGLTVVLPRETYMSIIFIGVQAGLAYVVANALQGDAIAYHVSRGGPIHSLLRAAGVGLLTGLAVLFALLTATALILGTS